MHPHASPLAAATAPSAEASTPAASHGIEDAGGAEHGEASSVPPPPCVLLHTYLLCAHRVRSRPSGVDPATLILEPPAVAARGSVERVCAALRALSALLDRGETAEVVRYFFRVAK